MADKSILDLAPYALEARPRLVVAAMHGVVARFREPEICIYPLLDALHLLVPKPIVLSFLHEVEEGKYAHRLSTIQDKSLIDRLIEWINRQPPKEFAERLVRVPACAIGAKPLVMLVSTRIDGADRLSPYEPCAKRIAGGESDPGTDLWLFDCVFTQLAADATDDELSRDVLRVLHALPPRPYHTPSLSVSQEESEALYDRVAMEKILRDMLDEAWAEASSSPLLDSRNSRSTFKNIFPVVRFALPWRRRDAVNHEFDFSAQLLIPSEPRAEMHRFLNAIARKEEEFRSENHMSAQEKRQLFETSFGASAERVLAALEQPLGQGEGSIADTVFLSGQMDYLAIDFTESVRTERTSDRADAEALLLGEHGQQLSYIPVHVGGTPWVALFSMNTDEGTIDAHFWRHNFHLYSNIIPVLAAGIRRAAHNAYRRAIINTITECMSVPERRNRTSINDDLRALCSFFPFQMVQIEDGASSARIPHTLDGSPIKVCLLPSPSSAFNEPLTFDQLSLEEVAEACAEAFRSDELKTLERMRDNATTWAHEISNAVLPAFSALHRSVNRTADSDPDLRSAMHWLLFMGGTARVRNAIGKHIARTGSNDTPTPESQVLWTLPKAIQTEVVEKALLFLLRSHARVRRDNFILEANQQELSDADDQDKADVDVLGAILAEHRKGSDRFTDSDVAVFYSDVVSWPLALLRELVQNIRLANPPSGIPHPKVDFSFEWLKNPVGARAVLRTRQRQIEDRQWEESLHDELPDGIISANLVYGRVGAGFGDIELVSLSQDEISDSGIYRIEYVLDVRFF